MAFELLFPIGHKDFPLRQVYLVLQTIAPYGGDGSRGSA